MSLSRTNSLSLKALAIVACALTAFSGITIPAPAQAQVYRGRAIHMGPAGRPFVGRPFVGRPGFVGRPAFRTYRAGYYPYARPIYRGGYYPYARPIYRGGYYRYARPAYGRGYRYPYYGYGYRSPYYGYRYPYYGYGYPYYGGYYRTYDDTGAVVAGLIGGLALGAIASAATRPGYRSATYAPYNRCFYERRQIVTRSGRAIVRRVRTCY